MTIRSPKLSRRAVIAAAAGAPLAASVPAKAAPAKPGFLWGAATAGHQIEGNNVASDVWLLEQVKPSVYAEPSGDACDSLQRWREDVALVKGMGLNCYRFSIEWARIEPAEGQFSLAFLDHYARIIDHCRDQGIAPVVTLNHFSSPRWFAAKGGWENPDAPGLFARYAERVARRMATGMSHAVTFNEPNMPRLMTWSGPMSPDLAARYDAMLKAAARACGSERFLALNTGDPDAVVPGIVAGHRLARAALKAARSDLPVGLSFALPDDQAAGPGSRIEEKRRLVYEPYLAAAREDDFIGIQTYNRAIIDAKGQRPPAPGVERTQSGDEYYPEALIGAIRYAHRASGVPVMVTENGIAATDDRQRVRYIRDVIGVVDRARAEGLPLLGYIHWSLLDNFEWSAGYGPRFGLVAVDRATFARTPKPSAKLYAELVRARV